MGCALGFAVSEVGIVAGAASFSNRFCSLHSTGVCPSSLPGVSEWVSIWAAFLSFHFPCDPPSTHFVRKSVKQHRVA